MKRLAIQIALSTCLAVALGLAIGLIFAAWPLLIPTDFWRGIVIGAAGAHLWRIGGWLALVITPDRYAPPKPPPTPIEPRDSARVTLIRGRRYEPPRPFHPPHGDDCPICREES